MNHTLPEFVGTTVLDTIGLVIANVAPALRKKMKMEAPYRSIGIISSRIGATGQIIAVDDAVKETNTKVLSIMLPRDTNYIVIGAETVADARKAVELTLEKTKKNAGEIYVSSAGHLEMAFSPRADQALELAFGIPHGKAFGFVCGCPAAIGMVMADLAVKSADVEIAKYMTPNEGTSHTNEVIVALSGETSAVKTAVLTAREAGLALLGSMEGEVKSLGEPYILS